MGFGQTFFGICQPFIGKVPGIFIYMPRQPESLKDRLGAKWGMTSTTNGKLAFPRPGSSH
jgi:hypothetical protein